MTFLCRDVAFSTIFNICLARQFVIKLLVRLHVLYVYMEVFITFVSSYLSNQQIYQITKCCVMKFHIYYNLSQCLYSDYSC